MAASTGVLDNDPSRAVPIGGPDPSLRAVTAHKTTSANCTANNDADGLPGPVVACNTAAAGTELPPSGVASNATEREPSGITGLNEALLDGGSIEPITTGKDPAPAGGAGVSQIASPQAPARLLPLIPVVLVILACSTHNRPGSLAGVVLTSSHASGNMQVD